MRRKIAGGSDARRAVRGRKARFAGMKNTLRYDARPAKTVPGRNARRSIRGRKARFAGMKNHFKIRRKAAFGRRRGRLRREVRLGSTSQEVMPGGASGDSRLA